MLPCPNSEKTLALASGVHSHAPLSTPLVSSSSEAAMVIIMLNEDSDTNSNFCGFQSMYIMLIILAPCYTYIIFIGVGTGGGEGALAPPPNLGIRFAEFILDTPFDPPPPPPNPVYVPTLLIFRYVH